MRNETVLVTIIYITLLSSAEPIAQNNIPSAVYSVDNHSEATDKNEQLIDRTRLETAIRLSANYLHEICSQNGRFTYLINTNPKVIPHSAYNILRHAGTVYALAMFRQWSFDDSNNEAIIRAAHFILRETVAPVPGRVDLLAVGSDPDITDRQRPVAAKLGGTGLGLNIVRQLVNLMDGDTWVESKVGKGSTFFVLLQLEAKGKDILQTDPLINRPGDLIEVREIGDNDLPKLAMLFQKFDRNLERGSADENSPEFIQIVKLLEQTRVRTEVRLLSNQVNDLDFNETRITLRSIAKTLAINIGENDVDTT